jgi:hypothetical protein
MSGNQQEGLIIEFESADDVVEGNYMGTDVTGSGALANGDGILLDGAGRVFIGGTEPGAGNLISGNIGAGIDDVGSRGGVIQGNRIGTDASGTSALGNGGGLGLFSAYLIGGTEPGAGNVIAANNGVGVFIAFQGIVQGNFIGTDATGTRPLGNRGSGVVFEGSGVVGGTDPGAGNVISANGGDGVDLFSLPGSAGGVVQGNFIGTDVTGTVALGNARHGVFVSTSGAVIGGVEPGAGNVIANNQQDGVAIDFGTGNAIRQNALFGNARAGIELLRGGNRDQAAPELASAIRFADGLTVAGVLQSTPNRTFDIEFFVNTTCDSGPGQGEAYLFTLSVTTDGNGLAAFEAATPADVSSGAFITATATSEATQDTSTFSACIPVTDPGRAPRLAQRLQTFAGTAAASALSGIERGGLAAVGSWTPWLGERSLAPVLQPVTANGTGGMVEATRAGPSQQTGQVTRAVGPEELATRAAEREEGWGAFLWRLVNGD